MTAPRVGRAGAILESDRTISYSEDPIRLALFAHDNEKVDLVAWASFNHNLLARVQLVGTGHSATLVREKVGLEVETPRAVTSSNASSALADTRGG